MIERAKQDSALHTIDPAALLNLLNTLITVSSRTGKEEGPQHILPYVANVARMAPFKYGFCITLCARARVVYYHDAVNASERRYRQFRRIECI